MDNKWWYPPAIGALTIGILVVEVIGIVLLLRTLP